MFFYVCFCLYFRNLCIWLLQRTYWWNFTSPQPVKLVIMLVLIRQVNIKISLSIYLNRLQHVEHEYQTSCHSQPHLYYVQTQHAFYVFTNEITDSQSHKFFAIFTFARSASYPPFSNLSAQKVKRSHNEN